MDLFLIEPGLLQQKLGRPDLVVIDCSWYSPEAGKCGLESFREGHIPAARYFDLDAASDKTSPYPNMLPSTEQFAEVVGSLGIDNDTRSSSTMRAMCPRGSGGCSAFSAMTGSEF